MVIKMTLEMQKLLSLSLETRQLLLTPLTNGADHLFILCKDASPVMASWLVRAFITMRKKASLSIVVGNTNRHGISLSYHEGFCDLQRSVSSHTVLFIRDFSCGYYYGNCNLEENYYIWFKNDRPYTAFKASAQFLQPDFFGGVTLLLEKTDVQKAKATYDSFEAESIYCQHSEVQENITIYSDENYAQYMLDSYPEDTLRLSLLSRSGDVGTRSGLNWGQRPGRNKNQAYIPLPIKHAHQGFFPLDTKQFFVLTDDRKQLILRVEQQNDKAITTPLNNSLLGEYFRNRLGKENGAYISRADLERYGRTDVAFTKFDDEHFYMDYSV